MVADEAEKNQILKENEEQTTKKITEKVIQLESKNEFIKQLEQ